MGTCDKRTTASVKGKSFHSRGETLILCFIYVRNGSNVRMEYVQPSIFRSGRRWALDCNDDTGADVKLTDDDSSSPLEAVAELEPGECHIFLQEIVVNAERSNNKVSKLTVSYNAASGNRDADRLANATALIVSVK